MYLVKIQCACQDATFKIFRHFSSNFGPIYIRLINSLEDNITLNQFISILDTVRLLVHWKHSNHST